MFGAVALTGRESTWTDCRASVQRDKNTASNNRQRSWEVGTVSGAVDELKYRAAETAPREALSSYKQGRERRGGNKKKKKKQLSFL